MLHAMLLSLAQAETDWVAFFKTASVVVVAIAFLAIVVRALGARPSAMRKGAHMPLDDPQLAGSEPSSDELHDPTRA